ncbi:MAG: hypothetical protein LBG19_11425 [Prevotellaceae bacterium]|jgi:hypothetical protein|nr:hypothetical protein [Prevotellaceae bacterium]
MNKENIKQKFLGKLELYHRNFGGEWTFDEFFKDNEPHKDLLINYLQFLSTKGIVIIDNKKQSFKIMDLPSNHNDLT